MNFPLGFFDPCLQFLNAALGFLCLVVGLLPGHIELCNIGLETAQFLLAKMDLFVQAFATLPVLIEP